MREVLLRPKWLVALVVALAVAAGFAALAQWQLDSAIRSAQHQSAPALGPTTLGDAATPQAGLYDVNIGRGVSFAGVLDPRDFDIVSQRLQHDELGYWVIGHAYVTHDGETAYDTAPRAQHAPGIAVAVGWAATLEQATAAVESLRATTPAADAAEPVDLAGRLEYGQTPVANGGGVDPHELQQMAPAHLVNRWAEAGPRNYGSYVILDLPDAERAGLAPIAVQSPDVGSGLNMLNVFYAAEWVIFACFAVYVWWRLARAEYDRERDAALALRNPDEVAAREIRLERLRALRDERSGGPRGGS